jgi:dihydroflavonol-4-reductase
MRALVTGASGFVGVHLTRLLRERGHEVRCLVRPSSRRAHLDGLGVSFHVGDLSDRRVLRHAIDGCDVVFHCAADYRFQASAPDELYRNNVVGSENLFAAAADVGVGRVVYTSSVATLGLSSDGTAACETAPSTLASMIGAYKRSKFLAERVADSFVAMGKLPIVIVNPSTPVGEDDARPTPTGQFLVDFLSGRIPAYVDTGLNVVDVRDVAEGHLLAAERGVVGERYILGHRNVTLAELLDMLAQISGVRWARVRLPHVVPLLVAAIEAPLARLRRRPPRVSLEAVRLARKKMFFDPGKAVRELGLPQSPIETALARAVAWFRAQGYVKS